MTILDQEIGVLIDGKEVAIIDLILGMQEHWINHCPKET